MLSSPLSAMLQLSKTTYPPKLFPSDCITLYDIEYSFHFVLNFTGKISKSNPKRLDYTVALDPRFRYCSKVKRCNDEIQRYAIICE